MLFFNAKFIDYRLKKLDQYIEAKQTVAKKYDELLDGYVYVHKPTNGLNHTYHKYIIRFDEGDPVESGEARDRIKGKIGAGVHYEKPISERPMYKNIEHRSDNCKNAKYVSKTILTLPIHPWLTDEEIKDTCNGILNNL
jgi:dTDP-4-amino-4,6-dideoxygalactose transaminase